MKNDHYLPPNHADKVPQRSGPNYYAIRIKGLIDPHWDWLEGLTVAYLKRCETLISGPIMDQATLHGLLSRIRDLNLTLLAVNQIDPLDHRKEE
jgi:hypothetical protein